MSKSKKAVMRTRAVKGEARPAPSPVTAAVEVRTLSTQETERVNALPDAAVSVSDDPSAVFGHLLEQAGSTQRRNTLECLRQACEYQARQAVPDFGYSAIARTVQELGRARPKQQTIFNDVGLKQLIDAYRAKHAPATRQDDGDMLRHIPDLQTRHEVKLLLGRVEQLERVNALLHANYQKLELAAATAPAAGPALPPSVSDEQRAQRRAVKEFVRNLQRLGFYWHEPTGALMESRGKGGDREVGPPHLRQALEAFLGEDLGD